MGQSDSMDEQLAAQYYRNEEYDKAAMYYKKLYESTGGKTYYSYYIKSLLALEKYDEAIKVVKRRMRQENEGIGLHVDLGKVYEAAGEPKKARKEYEEAIENLPTDQRQINDLANKFINMGKPEYALEVYRKGQKMFNGYSRFNFEIARVYGVMGNHQKMIGAYLDLLEVNNAYLQSVQNALDRALDFSEDGERTDLLKRELLKRIQADPDKSVYTEMLIWLYVQHEDFQSAFVQARAMDKRQGGDGSRLLSLARVCTRNEAYGVAARCYEYLIDKGPEAPYYMESRIALLDVLNKKVTGDAGHTREDLVQLEGNYEKALRELGRNPETASMMKDLAHLKAFHLDEQAEADSLLREVLDIAGLSETMKAKCKLELADVLLLEGRIWDASLYYSQVEKAFKHDKLGHEAKFKNAKISFYTGEFEWAQAQLDVLKASTSKLIANDAMDLSLLITDNLNLDTTTLPMEMYARSDLRLFRNDHEGAMATLDSIMTLYPGHDLEDEILFQKFRIEKDRMNFQKAADHLNQIFSEYPDDILGDNALFELAVLHEEVFDNEDKASELYKRVMTDYPASLYTVEARKRFRALRGDPPDKPQ